jgi:hypothetical protein
MTDEERARRLFDWVIDHIRAMAVMVVVIWVVMAVMCFGIITNAKNGTDQSRKLEKIITNYNAGSLTARQENVAGREQIQRAIQCVVDQFAEHRVTNQSVHDDIATALGIEPTPHNPLPPRATEEEIAKTCAEFYPGRK